MNDTVKRIMQLADNYALQTRFDLSNTLTGKPTEAAPYHRQALQDELTWLFTPLTDEQIASIEREAWIKYSGTKIAVNTTQGAVMVRMAEKVHGITGEKNGVLL